MPAYTPTITPGATGTLEYSIGFPYIRREDLRVFIDNVEIAFGDGAGEWLLTDSGTKIKFQLGDEPQTGEELRITRTTAIDEQMVEWEQGSGVTARNLNRAFNQALYALEESYIPYFDSGEIAWSDVLAGDFTMAHHIGAIPTRWQTTLTCISAQDGYTPGQALDPANPGAVYFDDEFAYFDSDIAGVIVLFDPADGSTVVLDGAKWTFRVKAWR